MNKSALYKALILLPIFLIGLTLTPTFNVKAQEELPTLRIQIISPSNTTYNQNTILVNVSSQKQLHDNLKYTIGYILEGENTKIYGGLFQGTPSSSQIMFHSEMITDLPDGTYLLWASADYLDGRWWIYSDEQTVTFTIDTKTPTPSPTPSPSPSPEQALQFPSTLEITIVATAVLTGFGLFAILVKRRSKPK